MTRLCITRRPHESLTIKGRGLDLLLTVTSVRPYTSFKKEADFVIWGFPGDYGIYFSFEHPEDELQIAEDLIVMPNPNSLYYGSSKDFPFRFDASPDYKILRSELIPR